MSEPTEEIESLDKTWKRWQVNGGTWDVGGMAVFIERLWYALEAATEAVPAPAARPQESEAERTVRSIATMLGWVNVPPRHVLEFEISTLKARVRALTETRPPV